MATGHVNSGIFNSLPWLLLSVILIAVHLSLLVNAADNWQRLPTLDTYASYEDMQRYFDQRNLHSLRHIDNPTDDSYLAAFNQYNEQPALSSHSSQAVHPRAKREQRQLPSAPRMLRFELSDAVEPSAELKQYLRQHHDRALSSESTESNGSSSANKKKAGKSRRSRRSTVGRQPANFKVQMIPFEATDAREPDAITAKLISRAKALDLERHPALDQQGIRESTSSQSAEQPKSTKSRGRKSKRSKRSASLHVMKFELADAKTSLPAALQRSGKKMSTPSLLTMETQTNTVNQNQTTQQETSSMDDNLVSSGESAAESKRLYVYKDAPSSAYIKSKKSTIGLPHEVHKVITQLIKDGHGGKAYVKYLPPHNSNYEHFKTKAIAYSHKPALNVKYVPVKPFEPVQVHIQPVPVVEQLRYVYKPAYAKVFPVSPTLSQPIVVQEAAPPPPPQPHPQPVVIAEEVHHTYSAELSAPQAETPQSHPHPHPQQATTFVHPQFRPSKPDPLLTESSPIYGRPIEQHNYEPAPQMIKIEYHAPLDSINDHYKQLPEFRELSTLIGKSPDDQIHGLTYLLAKEMQAKLQRQPKQLLVAQAHDRPQDNTAPIQFHPAQQAPELAKLNTPQIQEQGTLGVQPGRLIGMAKSKQYVPIVEPGNNDVAEVPVVAPAKLPTPNSFIDFTPGHGLSNGYEGVHDEHPVTTVEHLVHHHHPTSEVVASPLPAQLEADKIATGVHYVHSHADKAPQLQALESLKLPKKDEHDNDNKNENENGDVDEVK
ncbi:hypothetical protein ACLKA7_013605 [Drosophila subpalustris]